MKKSVLLVIGLVITTLIFGQEKDPLTTYPVSKYEPLTLKITQDGQKYIRFIMWHQIWAASNNLAVEDSKFQTHVSIRRSRFLAYAQISPKFLILTHWGLNNLNADNLSALGNSSDAPQLFLHDAWGEVMINDALYIGGGIHYWKGLTRLANQSTLNFMTLDQSRPFTHWHSLGITDQFARHIGVYAKGQVGQFDYRVAVNNPLNPANSLGGGQDFGGRSELTYTGASNAETNGNPTGNTIIEGYFRYNFFELESTKLPYQVGTYFGNKKLLSVGAGVFAHPNGMYNATAQEHENVMHLAGDVFFDYPVGKNNAINAYASFINFDYGDNYMSRWTGTGTNLYAHIGYYIGDFRLMPYVAFQTGNYDAFDDNLNAMDVGVNYLLNGHNAKVTLEYHTISNNPLEGGVSDTSGDPIGVKQVRLQLHVFL